VSAHPQIQYRLQNATAPLLSGQTHLLITARYPSDLEPTVPSQEWYVASSGALPAPMIEQLSEAWAGAVDVRVERRLTVLGAREEGAPLSALSEHSQPLSVQLRQLSTQLRSLEEPETTMELELDMNELVEPPMNSSGELYAEATTASIFPVDESEAGESPPTHLIICLPAQSRHSPPPERDVRDFESVTIFVGDDSPLIWPWVSWCHSIGAELILSSAAAKGSLQSLITRSASVLGRAPIMLRPNMEGKLSAIVALNAPFTGRLNRLSEPLRVPLTGRSEQLAWLVSVEPKYLGDGPRELLMSEVNGERHVIQDQPLGAVTIESGHPAVNFAHQLAQRGRVLELLISSYLSSDLRRVAQSLDQWLKLSVSLESERSSWIHQVRVKLLHLGRIEPDDLRQIIRYALFIPYELSLEGVWKRRALSSLPGGDLT